MVQSGISRTYGATLRNWLGAGMKNPITALMGGIGVTVLLQSSTATAMLMTSFASRGIVETAPALAILLGADVGTTLVAQVFTLDLSWLAPLLMLVGLILHRNSQESERQELGRVVMGIGLMLFALKHLISTSEPLRTSGLLPLVLPSLEQDLLILLLLGALMAWLAHSSLATVLLVISLTATNVISLQVSLALVLGVNVGGVFPAVLATVGKSASAKRLSFGNLFFKVSGAAMVLPFLDEVEALLSLWPVSPERQVANFHTAFNLALAIVFLFMTPLVAKMMTRVFPDEKNGGDHSEPLYLDPNAIKTPAVAIALAEQETLRMCGLVENMLRGTLEVFNSDNKKLLGEIERMDDGVDRLNESIKLYLTKVSREGMGEKNSRRVFNVITFATNLEHIGDIIEKNLMELAGKKIRKKLRFSEDGLADITRLHDALLEQFALGSNVFMTGDVQMARRLLAEKENFRDQVHQASEKHLERLKAGKIDSIDSSPIHLDTLRDLKRINSHITTVVYPILDEAGQLWASRLKKQG